MEQTTSSEVEAAEAIRRVWEAQHERLWRSVLAWSGNHDIASDAVAEAFAQALRRGSALDHPDRWVWRASFRIAAGMLADRGRHDGGAAPDIADPASGPDAAAELIGALQRLDADDRRLVVLSIVGGWPSHQLAQMSDTAPGTIRVRLHRAKKRLRSELEAFDA